MYYRIKNRLDAEVLKKHLCAEDEGLSPVMDRIIGIADTLDDAYGMARGATAWGGYVLFFPAVSDYETDVVDLWDCYNIDPVMYEYMDRIGNTADGTVWVEKLFLLSSDDSLVFVYPQEQGARHGG